MQLRSRKRPGQSIVLIAVFGFILFIFVGLGIDSGMLYLERRQLQNAVDASCLAAATELGVGGTSANAVTQGQNYFAENLNRSATVAFALTFPVTGSSILPASTGQGSNLTNGIEVDNQDIRVASTLPAYTYFMRIAGITQYNVMARAHCGATAGGGLLPVAVVRFPSYNHRDDRIYGANTTKALPQTYGNNRRQRFMEVRDALRTESVGVLNSGVTATTTYPHTTCISSGQWYHWADNAGLGDYTTTPRKGPYWNPELTAGCAATVDNPGYPLELAGNGASASVGSTSFRGPIALDVRQIGVSGGPVYYNNWEQLTSANAKKDRTVDYIKTQYPGPPVAIGEQVGLLSGVNAGNIIAAVQDRYPVGSRVITVVYNGHVFRLGDFDMAITCVQGNRGCDNDGTNGGRYVERAAPPTSNHPKRNNSTNVCEYSGEYYIADRSQPGFTASSIPDISLTAGFTPAEYNVRLSPVSGSSANSVKLVARLSGANIGSSGYAGSPENFGNFKVRWRWTDPLTGTAQQTPYNFPDQSNVQPNVTLPATGALDVKLDVIQTASPTSVTCHTSLSVNVPPRSAGAYSIQVVGTENTSGRSHARFGLLGMEDSAATGSNKFTAGEYFMSFINEPVDKVIHNDPQTLQFPIQMTKADDPSNSPNDDDYTQGELGGMTGSITWYKDGVRQTSTPANLSASLIAPVTSGGSAGKEPLLQVDLQAGGVVTGTYDIDLQLQGSNIKTRSSRYRVVVESATNASIDEWITAVCYAEFELLGEGGSLTRPYKSNELWGRATSGCKDADSLKKSLTSRLLAW